MSQEPTPPPANPFIASNRAPMLWGIAVGIAQAATPLAFWWLDSATVYALGLSVIAAIYVGSPWPMGALTSSPSRPASHSASSSSPPPPSPPPHGS